MYEVRPLWWAALVDCTAETRAAPGHPPAYFRALRRWREINLIHVNEITAVIAAVMMKALFHKPVGVHVRSVQQMTGIPLRRRLLEFLLQRYADAVIAIDATVRANLPASINVDIGSISRRT